MHTLVCRQRPREELYNNVEPFYAEHIQEFCNESTALEAAPPTFGDDSTALEAAQPISRDDSTALEATQPILWDDSAALYETRATWWDDSAALDEARATLWDDSTALQVPRETIVLYCRRRKVSQGPVTIILYMFVHFFRNGRVSRIN